VHATSQVIALTFPIKINMTKINEVNSFLPKDIKVIGYTQVSLNFSPRYDAIYRHYKYITPYKRENLILMKYFSKSILGFHDFKKISSQKTTKNTLRRLIAINIQKLGNFLHIDIIGRSFCRGMIRKTLSLLIEAGKGNIKYNDLSLLLNPVITKTTSLKYALPTNLILYDIKYPVTFHHVTKAIINFIDYIKYKLSNTRLSKQIFMSFKSYFAKNLLL